MKQIFFIMNLLNFVEEKVNHGRQLIDIAI